MRVTSSDLSSRLVFALLTALLFIALSGQAYAQSRSFQMALWAESDDAAGVDTDIPVFYDGESQPDGRSILIRFNLNKAVSAGEYEWSRIVAVLFDEPYNDFNGLQGPCWSSTTVAAVNARVQVLADRAAELKSVAPLTRFWVNLAKPQLDWVIVPQCADENLAPVNVNKPYIDVISLDRYEVDFNTNLKPYYDWWADNPAKPDQQIALIPGTYYRAGRSPLQIGGVFNQALLLQGYFDYANNANQSCNLPRGSRGLTGSFDGCRVWIVLGWLAHNFTDGVVYIGERDASSAPIANVWQTELALPLRPDLAHQVTRGQLLPAILPLLME